MLKDRKVTVAGKLIHLDLEYLGKNDEGQRIYQATDHAYSDYAFIQKRTNRFQASYDPGKIYRGQLPIKYTQSQRGGKG